MSKVPPLLPPPYHSSGRTKGETWVYLSHVKILSQHVSENVYIFLLLNPEKKRIKKTDPSVVHKHDDMRLPQNLLLGILPI